MPSRAQIFLYRHQFLHMVWVGLPRFFPTITLTQQRVLHDYYLPVKELTDEQLHNHQAITAGEQPSLAALAGKAFHALERNYLEITELSGGDPDRLLALLRQREHYTTSPARVGRLAKHRVRVTAVMRPEIDAERLAQVLIEVTKDEIARERDGGEPTDDA